MQRGALLNKTTDKVRALTAHEAEEEEAAMVEMAMMQSFYETGRGTRAPVKDPDWDDSWCDGEEESDFDDMDAEADDPDTIREAKQDSAH